MITHSLQRYLGEPEKKFRPDVSRSEERLVLPWFAVYVRPKAERTVERALREKGLEAFAPYYRSRRRWRDRTVERDFPLFPGYLFARTDRLQRLSIVSTTGVLGIVGFGGQAAELSEEEVLSVRKLAEVMQNVTPHPFLRVGRKIRVKTGPLAGVEGVVVRCKGGHRLVVSISLLQRSIAAELDAADVESIC
jgi:transcription antitermination factor NusG